MFGVSFGEVLLVAVVALVVAGPRRLPELLGTLGQWIGRIRRMTTEVRRQTGIDDILRQEGLQGGLNELRSMMRGGLAMPTHVGPAARAGAPAAQPDAVVDGYGDAIDFDRYREFPLEGPDSYGAIPEDLVHELAPPPPAAAGEATPPAAAPTSPEPASPAKEPA